MIRSFSVRCLFLWPNPGLSLSMRLYEERITLWQASDFDEALALAEAEGANYATDNQVEFLKLLQAYELTEPVSISNVEIFSLLRESALDPDRYVAGFFDTGAERSSDHV